MSDRKLRVTRCPPAFVAESEQAEPLSQEDREALRRYYADREARLDQLQTQAVGSETVLGRIYVRTG